MRNNTTVSRRILAVLLVYFLCIGGIAYAKSVAELRQAMQSAADLVDEKEKDHEDANDHLNKQIANFIRLHGHLVNISMPSQSPATNTLALTAKLTKIIEKLINTHQLTSVMQEQLTAIETQRGNCDTIWADVVLAQTAYEDAVDAYNAAVSPEERVPTDPMPTAPPTNNLYLCPGPCSTAFTTLVLATTTHKVFCQVPPHQTSGYSYYSCPPDYENICPAKAFHQTPCGGGCGTLFAKNTGTRPRADDVHRTQCNERTSRNIFNGWTGNCIGDYYSCNGQTSADCSNVSAHVRATTPPTGGTTNPPPSNPSPSYHPCDVHLTSVIGNHSLQATCSSSNENGNCTVTNFYACDGHTHTYPEPTLVACGRRACTERVSERNKHRTDPCSACNGSYWSCGPHADYHYNQHRERTCRRMGCGQQWRRCQGPTPSCSVAAGQGCWAQ